MKEEISVAVLFLVRLIEKSEKFNKSRLEDLRERLTELFKERFENHWYPEQPSKGLGYRCIRINELSSKDRLLERAALDCGHRYEDLMLPPEFTLWVDPGEVTCRFGEQEGSCCILASFQGSTKSNRNSSPSCTPMSVSSKGDRKSFIASAKHKTKQRQFSPSPPHQISRFSPTLQILPNPTPAPYWSSIPPPIISFPMSSNMAMRPPPPKVTPNKWGAMPPRPGSRYQWLNKSRAHVARNQASSLRDLSKSI